MKVSSFVFSTSGDIKTSMVSSCILSIFVLDIFPVLLVATYPLGEGIWWFFVEFFEGFGFLGFVFLCVCVFGFLLFVYEGFFWFFLVEGV